MIHKNNISTIFFHVIAIIFSFVALLPFAWMLSTSFKKSGALLAIPIQWIPKDPTFASYTRLFQNEGILRSMLNSLIVTGGAVIFGILSSSMAAFAFAKIRFKGNGVLFMIFIASMMIPGQVTFIPLYLIMNDLHLTDTLWALILPCIFQAFAVFMLRQEIKSMNDTYLDAAAMDGASLFTTFFIIILPMCKAALITLAIIMGMGAWNDYLLPLVLLASKAHFTLPIILNSLNGQFSTDYNLLMAGSLVSMFPLIILYAVGQQYFKEGLQLGGIKQ